MNKIIFAGFLLFSCNNILKPDFEKSKNEILQLEAMQREYHFNKNAKDFTRMFSDNFLSINRGEINQPTAESSFKMFDAYFKSVEFVKWDDKEKPIVRFSDDGSVAWVAVNKLVIVKPRGKDASAILDTTNFAWLTIYKKEKNEWKIDCVTSTNAN